MLRNITLGVFLYFRVANGSICCDTVTYVERVGLPCELCGMNPANPIPVIRTESLYFNIIVAAMERKQTQWWSWKRMFNNIVIEQYDVYRSDTM